MLHTIFMQTVLGYYIRIDSIEDVKEKLSSLINDIKIWMNGRKLKLNDGDYHCQGESKIKCC